MKKEQSTASALDTHKQRLHRAKNHPFIVPVITLIGLVIITLFASVIFGAQTLGPADSRVVTIYEDGQSRTLPTRAKTVGDLLERVGITVNKNDVVEPSLKTQILEDDFTVNIYRSRTITIIDGNREITRESAQQSARAIAREAGLKLYPEDIVDIRLPADGLELGLVNEEIVIDRSIPIKLVLFGQSYEVRTHSKTVGQLLEEKEIAQEDITVFPRSNAQLKKGSIVYVTSPGKRIVSVEQTIEVPVQYEDDDELPLGTEQVKEKGAAGKRVVLYEIDKKTKKRKVLQTITAYEAQPRIIARGTGVIAPANISGSKIDWMRAAGIDPSQYGYVDSIIARESGWDPAAVSANRCIGLGQRCSAEVLIAECPAWQSDPVCQLGHFNAYAVGRYGSWQGAYSFWQANHWW